MTSSPRKTKLKADTLIRDYTLYPRAQIDDQHAREIKHAMDAGHEMPPILVDKASLRVVDGFHRLEAFLRKEGADQSISALVKEYESDAAIFEDAIRLNAAHGQALSTYDKTRAAVRGDELGLSRDQISVALNVTRERLDKFLVERVGMKGEVLKRTTAHLAGKTLTPAQVDFTKRAGGMDQLFYITQVTMLLESDSVDWDRDKVVEGLRTLGKVLDLALAAVRS